MHPGILSAGIENEGRWPWSSRSFWLRILGNLACSHRNCNEFEIKPTNLRQISILGFSRLVLKMRVIDHDLQGDLAISTQNSKKRHSTLLLHTDQGRSRGVTRPNVLLYCIFWGIRGQRVYIARCKEHAEVTKTWVLKRFRHYWYLVGNRPVIEGFS